MLSLFDWFPQLKSPVLLNYEAVYTMYILNGVILNTRHNKQIKMNFIRNIKEAFKKFVSSVAQ